MFTHQHCKTPIIMDTAPPNYPPTHWIPSKSAKHWFVKWSISSSLKCGPLVAPVLLKIVGVCSSSTKNNNQKETFYYSVHEPSTVPLSHCTMSPVRAWRGRILCSLLLWWVAEWPLVAAQIHLGRAHRERLRFEDRSRTTSIDTDLATYVTFERDLWVSCGD